MDKRKGRVQTIKLDPEFFPLDIHKSMFINDRQISLPAYYVKNWGDTVLKSHNKKNCSWEVTVDYRRPKQLTKEKMQFKVQLKLRFSKRSQESNYKLIWGVDFAAQLAKDYPKSFVRSLEFHLGDEKFKKMKYHEFDIGGFKEQLQVKITWTSKGPQVVVKEFFRVREEEQGFPNVYGKLSSYLIADYLLGSEKEILRRIQVTEWNPRKDIGKELNENNIYILLDRQTQGVYFGETKQSLSKRYPIKTAHHSFNEWSEYTIIQLPPETSDHTRLLIERVLIAVGYKLFPNQLVKEETVQKKGQGLELRNKKK